MAVPVHGGGRHARRDVLPDGLFQSFVSFVDDADGTPVYENTLQYAILKHEWPAARSGGQ